MDTFCTVNHEKSKMYLPITLIDLTQYPRPPSWFYQGHLPILFLQLLVVDEFDGRDVPSRVLAVEVGMLGGTEDILGITTSYHHTPYIICNKDKFYINSP